MIARDESEPSDSIGFTDSGAFLGAEQEVPVALSAAMRTQQVDNLIQQQQTSSAQTTAAADLSSPLTPLCSQADLLLKGEPVMWPHLLRFCTRSICRTFAFYS